jgi:CPA1 family monovalent cation:H+ antiporter
VFLLAGILFASTKINLEELWLPIAVTIVVVMIARALSVYVVILPLNVFRPVSRIPASWQILLAWGSLRGALAIIIVLLIPDNLTFDGWEYSFTPKELLLSLTIGCILTTLFFKAPTIGALITRMGVNKPSPLQEARMNDLGLYYLLTESDRISGLKNRGYIDQDHYKQLYDSLTAKISDIKSSRDDLRTTHGDTLFIQSLHYLAISIEEKYLKELYVNAEVNESVYRKIKGKLNLQQEKIEYAQHESINPSSYTDRKDVFDRLVAFTQNAFSRNDTGTSLENNFQYYRAQSIIARKVLKVLKHMQTQYKEPVFFDEIFDKVVSTYDGHRAQAVDKADGLIEKYPNALEAEITELSAKALHATGDKAIRFLEAKGMIDETISELLEHHYAISADPGHAGVR